jgi:hypothetical protein
MKLMEIITFLFIFGLVMNGLAVLRIASTSYTSDSGMSVSPEQQQTAMVAQIGIVVVAGISVTIVSWIAFGAIPLASGGSLPMDKIFGYGLLAGVMTVTLYGTVTTLWNIFEALPSDIQLGAGVMLAILLAIISFLATIGMIEVTMDKELLE